nr:MAG TPA: hypothetical protein [Caudoviricetes sp.]
MTNKPLSSLFALIFSHVWEICRSTPFDFIDRYVDTPYGCEARAS